jgi:hypothetical protein
MPLKIGAAASRVLKRGEISQKKEAHVKYIGELG